MKKLYYPVVLHDAEEGGYWVTFPNFPEGITEGETIEECIYYCRDVLTLILDDEKYATPPEPVPISEIHTNANEHIVIVEFDYDAFLAEAEARRNKPIKKTLTIPTWLNAAAVCAGINFSAVLKKALIEELDRIKKLTANS